LSALTELATGQYFEEAYLLVRYEQPSPLHLPTLHLLSAPHVDLKDSQSEDRRLAALCSELQVDLFISTGYTSAGANVRSVFVADDSMTQLFRKHPEIRSTAVYSARLASLHVALSEESARALSDISNVELKYITIVPGALELAKIVSRSMQSRIPDEIEHIRRIEEEKIRSDAERRQTVAQKQAQRLWNEAMGQGGRLPRIQRAWKAIRSVRRYPEYVKRILS